MYIDAKAAPKDFRNSSDIAFQIRSYGWSSQVPLSMVSNFEYFAIYDVYGRMRMNSSAANLWTQKQPLANSSKITYTLDDWEIKQRGVCKEMLAMAEINYIRYETNTKGKSY